MLTYESASELLHLNLEEEAELRLLSEAAARRLQWRRQQVSLAGLHLQINLDGAQNCLHSSFSCLLNQTVLTNELLFC